MEALRNVYTVENHRIVIDLPESFNYSAVEIIILPIQKSLNRRVSKNKKIEREARIKRLLNMSVWTEDEILPIIESQNLINQWKIDEF